MYFQTFVLAVYSDFHRLLSILLKYVEIQLTQSRTGGVLGAVPSAAV